MYEKEVAEKLNAMNQAKAQQSTGAAIGGCGLDSEPMRESLTGRFRNRLRRHQREGRKADQLGELLHLLEKNPEVARILDLVDALGNDY